MADSEFKVSPGILAGTSALGAGIGYFSTNLFSSLASQAGAGISVSIGPTVEVVSGLVPPAISGASSQALLPGPAVPEVIGPRVLTPIINAVRAAASAGSIPIAFAAIGTVLGTPSSTISGDDEQQLLSSYDQGKKGVGSRALLISAHDPGGESTINATTREGSSGSSDTSQTSESKAAQSRRVDSSADTGADSSGARKYVVAKISGGAASVSPAAPSHGTTIDGFDFPTEYGVSGAVIPITNSQGLNLNGTVEGIDGSGNLVVNVGEGNNVHVSIDTKGNYIVLNEDGSDSGLSVQGYQKGVGVQGSFQSGQQVIVQSTPPSFLGFLGNAALLPFSAPFAALQGGANLLFGTSDPTSAYAGLSFTDRLAAVPGALFNGAKSLLGFGTENVTTVNGVTVDTMPVSTEQLIADTAPSPTLTDYVSRGMDGFSEVLSGNITSGLSQLGGGLGGVLGTVISSPLDAFSSVADMAGFDNLSSSLSGWSSSISEGFSDFFSGNWW